MNAEHPVSQVRCELFRHFNIYKRNIHRHKLDFEHENQVNFLLFNILIDIDCTEVYSDERQRESTTNTAEEKN